MRERGNMKYSESNLSNEVLRAISEMGFEEMTPIQEKAIPVLLEGKDVIGQAQTGTGKTAAFGIPLIMSVNPDDRQLQAIVLCPTRELAIQAAEEIRRFAKYLHGIRVLPIYGGQEIYKQIKQLKGGVQIIVGTPGRVMDHMRRHTIHMEHVKMVVLDEADEMLNMGFRDDMETILNEIRGEHQTALFSATMPQSILDITGTYQKEDAEMIQVVKNELTISLVEQSYYFIKKHYKEEATARLLDYYNVHRALLFCNTKKMVDELADQLKKRGFLAEGLHGDLTQKQRDFVMDRFRSGVVEILIATDVAARGIDVEDVEAVINYDIPQDIEYYVHRIGRTGRAGKEGRAFTLVSGRDIYKIRQIEKICKTKMLEKQVPSSRAITSIKTQKVLDEVKDLLKEEPDLRRIKNHLEYVSGENGISMLDLAAGLLRLQMGEEIKDIKDMKEFHHYDKSKKDYQYKGKKEKKYLDKKKDDKKKEEHKRENSFSKKVDFKDKKDKKEKKDKKKNLKPAGKSGFRRERTKKVRKD